MVVQLLLGLVKAAEIQQVVQEVEAVWAVGRALAVAGLETVVQAARERALNPVIAPIVHCLMNWTGTKTVLLIGLKPIGPLLQNLSLTLSIRVEAEALVVRNGMRTLSVNNSFTKAVGFKGGIPVCNRRIFIVARNLYRCLHS